MIDIIKTTDYIAVYHALQCEKDGGGGDMKGSEEHSIVGGDTGINPAKRNFRGGGEEGRGRVIIGLNSEMFCQLSTLCITCTVEPV